ncbi:MAG TPA: YciI family protein [Polyangia bacterium]|nr:YciI family protein [Polyangia bacterium]
MPNHKYMFLHRSPMDGQPPSPARMQEMFAVWNAWKEKFKDNVVDMGGKLKPSGKVLTASGAIDGPFVEAKEIVGGYMIVTAESYEQALEMAREMYGMMTPGTRIEVREMAGP